MLIIYIPYWGYFLGMEPKVKYLKALRAFDGPQTSGG